MPALMTEERRRLIALLVLSGVGQAAAALTVAIAAPQLLVAGQGVNRVWLISVLLGAAALIGALRMGERILSERLAQSYVHQVRGELVASALHRADGPHLGITVARTTNDLSAVRNWIALGISPLLVGVPLILGVLVALLILSAPIAAVVAAVLAAFAATLHRLSRYALRRARTLRKRRGAMAAHIADTVSASANIRAAGGVHRELAHIDKVSARVASAAVARSVIAGGMRGSAAATGAVAMVLATVVGTASATPAGAITAALLLLGVIATPLNDLGRITEYRQSYRAARLILEPELQFAAHVRQSAPAPTTRRANGVPDGVVHLADLPGASELLAFPGERILLRCTDAAAAGITDALLHGSPHAWVHVDGRDLYSLPANDRRELVGWAARGTTIERGTIGRAVRYRLPRSDESPIQALPRVSLGERITEFPNGVRTVLRRGGDPLSTSERAQLLLARATLGTPPLLLLDHLDEQLDAAGRQMAGELIRTYPGVVLARTHQPEQLLGAHRVWEVHDADTRQLTAMEGATS